MTLNLKSVAFVPYVGQFSVVCMVVLDCFGTFLRRRRRRLRRKEPHVDLRAAGKNNSSTKQEQSQSLGLIHEYS